MVRPDCYHVEGLVLIIPLTAQSERFASGIPAERFGQIARREIRHKL